MVTDIMEVCMRRNVAALQSAAREGTLCQLGHDLQEPPFVVVLKSLFRCLVTLKAVPIPQYPHNIHIL